MSRLRLKYWAHIALMFLLRSGRSAMALSIMVITAVAALVFLSALAVGVNDAMLENSVGLFSGHITGYGLPASVLPDDLKVSGVRGVLKRVWMPGVLSNGTLDQPLKLCALDPEQEAAFTALDKKRIEGDPLHAGQKEAMISRALADDLGLHIGSPLQFSSPGLAVHMDLKVSGIYQTHIEQLDRGIAFIPLDVVPVRNIPWTASVFLNLGEDPKQIIKTYDRQFSGQYRFESWAEQMPDLRQLIDLQYISMAIVIFLVFGVVAVGIGCSFVIFIIKNIREYGIMKAMGVTTGEMSLLIMMKVALMNVIACALGLCIGLLISWGVAGYGGIDLTAFTSHNRYFSVSGIIWPRLTLFSVISPPATALVFSLIASLWPAALVARKKTADIIRMI